MKYIINMTIPQTGDTVELLRDGHGYTSPNDPRPLPVGSRGIVVTTTQHVAGEGRYVHVDFNGIRCLVHERSLRIVSDRTPS